MKKLPLIGIVIIILFVIGCTSVEKEPYMTDNSQSATPEIEIPVLMSESEERDLMVRWYEMYFHKSFGRTRDGGDRNDAIESFKFLKIQSIHPLRIYKGSMIFFHDDYGYLFIPSDEAGLRGGWPEKVDEVGLEDLLRKYDGKWEQAFPTARGSVVSFKRVEDMERFVSELWR